MADDDPKLDSNRYYTRPGCTEPELRPEFVEEEAAVKATAEAEADEAMVKKATKASKRPVAKKK